MAGYAAGIEILFASLRISGKQIQDLVCPAVRCRLVARQEKGGDIFDLIIGEIEFRHSAIRPTVQHDRSEGVSLAFIVKHNHGTDQIRSRFSTGSVCAVAESTIRAENLFSAINRRRIRSRKESQGDGLLRVGLWRPLRRSLLQELGFFSGDDRGGCLQKRQ